MLNLNSEKAPIGYGLFAKEIQERKKAGDVTLTDDSDSEEDDDGDDDNDDNVGEGRATKPDIGKWQRKMGKRWQALPEEEREKYKAEAACKSEQCVGEFSV